MTSLEAESWEKQKLYEELCCARGDMENRIKERSVLFADRVSVSRQSTADLSVRHCLHADERPATIGTAGDHDGDGVVPEMSTPAGFRLMKFPATFNVSAVPDSITKFMPALVNQTGRAVGSLKTVATGIRVSRKTHAPLASVQHAFHSGALGPM